MYLQYLLMKASIACVSFLQIGSDFDVETYIIKKHLLVLIEAIIESGGRLYLPRVILLG